MLEIFLGHPVVWNIYCQAGVGWSRYFVLESESLKIRGLCSPGSELTRILGAAKKAELGGLNFGPVRA